MRSSNIQPAVLLSALAASLVALPGSLVAQQTCATKSGKYFVVTCEGGDEHTAALALAVVEPVWSLTCATFGVREAKPKELLSVVLYRDVDGYLKADRRLTGGKFQPNQAMSHWGTKSAHVAMQPPVNDGYIKKFGLPKQTQAMLAWEACHIARFELCRNFRVHPDWFQDGLAAAVSRDALMKLHPAMGEQPFFTQRWWQVRRLAENNKLPTIAQLLSDRTEDLGMRNRYAVRLAFFEFVRDRHSDKLVLLAKRIRGTGAGTSYAGKIRKAAVAAFGDLGGEFQRLACKRQPLFDEKVRSLWFDGITWYQTAFAKTHALAFHQEPVKGGKFAASGTVLIHDGVSQQMNFVFARTKRGFYSLAITAGRGFTLFEHRAAGNEWRVIGSGNEPECRAGVDVSFSVRGHGKKLEVQLADHNCTFELPNALPDEIFWGVGAQGGMNGAVTGSSGVWRNITVRGN